MAFEVVVPQMGESVLEGTIVAWKVAEGDKVRVNQSLVEIMTDKINIEIPAEVEGVVERIMVKPGEVVPVGKLICTIAVTGEVPAKAAPVRSAAPSPAASSPAAKAPAASTAAIVAGEKAKMTPAVRKLARDYGLDPAAIVGTGPDGRIMREDVEKAAAARSVVGAAVTAAKTTPAAQPPKFAPVASVPGQRIEERIPLEGARKMIADHMVRSRHTSAHVTTFEDCDFTGLVELRARLKDQFQATYGAKLTYLPFIMQAVVEGLKQFPTLNASMTDTEIILKKYYNIGVAVARGTGLIVPVVHDADRKSIIELAVAINDLGERARTDQLKLDEVQGGTFTLTNAGMFGAMASTPIINQPQVAILGIHSIAERPVVRGGQIVIRHMSTFGLSFDHRLIDGHTAVQFLHAVIGYLEYPATLELGLR
jgi:2-oxoglutarate dehydrogenase complex dihydrolipoamide succinyltransferase (E2) component